MGGEGGSGQTQRLLLQELQCARSPPFFFFFFLRTRFNDEVSQSKMRDKIVAKGKRMSKKEKPQLKEVLLSTH